MILHADVGLRILMAVAGILVPVCALANWIITSIVSVITGAYYVDCTRAAIVLVFMDRNDSSFTLAVLFQMLSQIGDVHLLSAKPILSIHYRSKTRPTPTTWATTGDFPKSYTSF